MAMKVITVKETLGLERGSAVVCIPAAIDGHGSTLVPEQLLATTKSVLERTPSSTPILVAGPIAAIERVAEELSGELVGTAMLGLVLEPKADQTQAVNAAVRASTPSDIVLVTPGIRVTTGWLERLRAVATSDSTFASATPLSLGVGGLELFNDDGLTWVGPSTDTETDWRLRLERTREIDGIEEVARMVSERGLRLHPRIATVGPGCAYVRRAALDLAGPLEEPLALDEALSSFAIRLTAFGMVHVTADEVLVEGSPVRPQITDAHKASRGHLANLLQETIVEDEHAPLRRSLNRGRTVLRKLSVTIDGRSLVAAVGGTQTYIIELILALARQQEVAVRVLVAQDFSERAAAVLGSLSDVELLTYQQAIERPRLTDVVHRPQQVFTPDDLALLRLLGERVVIGQQDLIAYHNHSYHRDVDSWRSYRRITRLALAGADQVIFFSDHARHDALAEDLVSEGRAHVVGIGAENLENLAGFSEGRAKSSETTKPETLQGIAAGSRADAPFLLCLGADYAHKNRPFAIGLLGALRRLGWSGRLVFAGPHVPHGSSREHEQDLLSASPELAEFVVDLGPIDEPSKRWLYAHARALLYPTLYEGFGLLPLEAARENLPCLFAAQASLSETAGAAATLVAWDIDASAAAILPLLSDGPGRENHLAILRALSIPGWNQVANQLAAVYEHALAAPPSEAAPRSWQEVDRESHIVRLDQDITNLIQTAQEYQDAYHSLKARVRSGLPLIGENGLLSVAQQRGLMRVAARRGLGALTLAPFGLLGRLDSDDEAS